MRSCTFLITRIKTNSNIQTTESVFANQTVQACNGILLVSSQCYSEEYKEAGMEGSNGFGIDTILSHRANSPGLAQVDPLMGDSRSPLELSPGSEISSVCSPPPSPTRECLEGVNTRQGVALAIESHLQPGLSAPSQSRTVTSSFLIRDILADCKPLATCAPYSSNGQPAQDLTHCLSSKTAEDFRDKLEKSSSSTSSDSEYKGKVKEEGEREISSSRESPPVRLKKPRKARTAFTDHQLAQLERSFERQKYLSVQDRMELAASLNLTDTPGEDLVSEPQVSAQIVMRPLLGASHITQAAGHRSGLSVCARLQKCKPLRNPHKGIDMLRNKQRYASVLLRSMCTADFVFHRFTRYCKLMENCCKSAAANPLQIRSKIRNVTKWKRQTAVGLELLAEAGNYSALQRMFPSPYFYPQSLVSNLDPGAALYLYRGPTAPPPALQRPLVPRILIHGLQGGAEPPPALPPLTGVLPRSAQPR
ncbi:unnamed protein product [Ranitomeya imitator]|uniref:Homeobox domain-containing protein n=1 Tax=Ranitomeya imitator TaxID=111125 RepID=A0ABN9LF88_9NEOB|nr:unnamed protein product [Ranitomeya imitator]